MRAAAHSPVDRHQQHRTDCDTSIVPPIVCGNASGTINGIYLEAASSFIRALAGGDPVTFQTFSDRAELKITGADGTVRDPNARILHGALTQHQETLERLNSAGAGVYVMVNAGNGKGRAARNVKRVRALFIDTDGADYPESLPLKPHLVVQSSPNRWHLYWRVDGVSLENFSVLQAALAAHYGTDPSVKDAPRVMRLPGFYHRKTTPVMVELLEAHDHSPYTPAEIFAAWPPLATALATVAAESADKERHRAANLAAAKLRQALPSADDSHDRKRALGLLNAHLDRVAKAGDGTRHSTLYASARTLGGYVASGYLTTSEVEAELLDAAKLCELPEDEAADAISHGMTQGAAEPLILTERERGYSLTTKRRDAPTKKVNSKVLNFTDDAALAVQRTAHTEGVSSYLKRRGIADLFATHRVAPAVLPTGETVPGIVYSADEHGVFIQLALRDLEGLICGYRRIYGDQDQEGCSSKTADAFVLLEPKDKPLPKTTEALGDLELAICGNFATGASIALARPRSVVLCAFSAVNLAPVAEALRKQYGYTRRVEKPGGRTAQRAVNICIWGDHDESGAGQQAAHQVALETGCYIRLPKKRGDFNDLHAARGLAAVRRIRRVTPDAKKAFADELSKQQLSPDKHLSPIALPDEGAGLIVQAPQESGKTHQLAELLDRFTALLKKRTPRVLIVTHRISLGRNVSNRLEAEFYLDYPAHLLRDIPRLVVTFDSLQKLALNGKIPEYDLLVLDESEQLFEHVTGRHIKRKGANLAVFEGLLQTTPRVICADANAGSLTANTLRRYNPERKISRHIHEHHVAKGRNFRFTADRDDALDVIEAETRPTWVTADSLRFTRDLNAYLDDPRTLTINSETSTTETAMAYLANPTGQAAVHHRMIASPSVQTGLSDDSGHWQHVVAINSGYTSAPQDGMQGVMRPRQVKQVTAYAPRGRGTAVSVRDALDGAAAADKYEADALERDTYGVTNPNYEQLRAEVLAQRSQRQANYKSGFVLEAARLGFTVQVDVARNIAPKHLRRRDDRRAALKEAGLKRYVADRVSAQRIDATRAEALQEAYTLPQEDFFALELYQLRSFYELPDSVDDDTLADMLRVDDYKKLREKVTRYENFIEPRTVAEARARGELDAGVLKGDAKEHALRHEYHRQLGRVVVMNAATEAHAKTWQRETDDLETELRILRAEVERAQTRRKGVLLRQARRLETDLEARKLKTFGTNYRADSVKVRVFLLWCVANYQALHKAGLVTASPENLQAKPLETIGDSLRRAGLEHRHDGKRGAEKSYALTIANVSEMANYSRPRRKNWQFAQQTVIKALVIRLLCKNAILASQTDLITHTHNPEHTRKVLHGPDDLKRWLGAGRLDGYGLRKLQVIRQKVSENDVSWLRRLANSSDTGRVLGVMM